MLINVQLSKASIRQIWSIRGLFSARKIRFPFLILLLCLFGIRLFAQSSFNDLKKSSWSLYVVEGYRMGEDAKWSIPGVEFKYNLRVSESFNVQLRGGYMDWGDREMRAFPLMIGVSGTVINSNQFSINPYFITGPSLLVGNDYAGIFATAETGIEFAHSPKGFSVFIGYGKNMLFHSDDSDYIKGGVGYQF